jgi:hypothetical protein
MGMVHKSPDIGMRPALYGAGVILFLAAGASFCPAAGPYAGYPIGLSTIPPSSYGQDLVTLPNPIDVSANLVMTGNLAAGMQFRGHVPYGAPTELRTSLGSTRLDSFLRRSQGALGEGAAWRNMVPFYSPTATVTRLAPGSSDPILPQAGWMVMIASNDTTDGGSSTALTGAVEGAPMPVLPVVASIDHVAEKGVQPDLSGGIWADLQGAAPPLPRGQEPAGQPIWGDLGDANQPMDRMWPGMGPRRNPGLKTEEDPCGVPAAGGTPLDEVKRVRWVGSTQDFWQARYERCMERAASSLKAGKPSQAADAYTLAMMYKPGDALALAGKSHALFVGGEFVGSALFLARLLETCPDYARIQIDLPGLVGGEGILRSRIDEAGSYLRQNESDPLRLALAYVNYRIGEAPAAKEVLDKVVDKAPPWPTLKRAIDETLAADRPSR